MRNVLFNDLTVVPSKFSWVIVNPQQKAENENFAGPPAEANTYNPEFLLLSGRYLSFRKREGKILAGLELWL